MGPEIRMNEVVLSPHNKTRFTVRPCSLQPAYLSIPGANTMHCLPCLLPFTIFITVLRSASPIDVFLYLVLPRTFIVH
jgi:hypothetical protein